MGCAGSTCANKWSRMLPELLNLISRKYIVFYEDYLTFALVCKSWHSAAAGPGDYKNGLPSRFPSLLLAEIDKDGRKYRELFLLSNKSIRKIRLPKAYGKVCRSSCGWLITVGYDYATQLINPLSREIINLPKVDTFYPEFSWLSKRHEKIKKLLIVTNNPSPLVVVLWGSSYKIGFCRPGDNKWTTVGCSNLIGDITYYNRQVYTIDIDYFIRACDVHGEEPMSLVCTSSLWNYLHIVPRGVPYIIGLDKGETKRLVVVIRQNIKDGDFTYETSMTKRFLLFSYDLKDRIWSGVKDLGKKTLFVGANSTFWVEDTTGVIKSNCIYFTDDVDPIYTKSKNGGGGDMGIYHLSNGIIEPHYTGESRSLFTPPTWLESI